MKVELFELVRSLGLIFFRTCDVIFMRAILDVYFILFYFLQFGFIGTYVSLDFPPWADWDNGRFSREYIRRVGFV